MIQKSYQVLMKWVGVCSDPFDVTVQLREGTGAQQPPRRSSDSRKHVVTHTHTPRPDLLQVLRKRVCDVRWEVRDSTVEFLGHLAVALCTPTEEEGSAASKFLPGGRRVTVPLLQEALRDPESYVRASSVWALARTLAPSWQQGAALSQEEVG